MYNYYLVQKHFSLENPIIKNATKLFEGVGMKTGAYLTGRGWNTDINGTDLYPFVFSLLSGTSKSVFFLGGEESVIEKAVIKTKSIYPELKIDGYHHGYFTGEDDEKVVTIINQTAPGLLVIGMGICRELEFILRNSELLNVRAIWAVGGLFDFVSGITRRAPMWVRAIRLEWLFRFFHQPLRKFSRNIIVPFWFICHLIRLYMGSDKE